ncbi:Hypothetical protein FKW44_016038 [Caligus rogercresseyi]|uniref:Uncharacterized protein n=1 Tax=Caligus rogercresseyi TaxID=217165 RepID=A0A7T8H168_CALRO|nr:Hypothetical protein FKW44_016038 [Caligus rogercresseyi]
MIISLSNIFNIPLPTLMELREEPSYRLLRAFLGTFPSFFRSRLCSNESNLGPPPLRAELDSSYRAIPPSPRLVSCSTPGPIEATTTDVPSVADNTLNPHAPMSSQMVLSPSVTSSPTPRADHALPRWNPPPWRPHSQGWTTWAI